MRLSMCYVGQYGILGLYMCEMTDFFFSKQRVVFFLGVVVPYCNNGNQQQQRYARCEKNLLMPFFHFLHPVYFDLLFFKISFPAGFEVRDLQPVISIIHRIFCYSSLLVTG